LDQDAHKNGKTETQLWIFNMPAVIVEVSCAMKKKNKKHGQNPQPVNVIPSVLFIDHSNLPYEAMPGLFTENFLTFFINNPDNMINLCLRYSKNKSKEGSWHGFQKNKKKIGPAGYGLCM
jgi:hypothetical protein